MTRADFLEQLRIALQGNISQAQVNEHLRYYENYIIEESRKGRSEQEVIDSLGEPRLIARTLIDTSDNIGHAYDETYDDTTKQADKAHRRGFRANYTTDGKWDIRYGNFKLNSWYAVVLLLIILVAVLVIVGHLLMFLLPVILVILGIGIIISWLIGKKR